MKNNITPNMSTVADRVTSFLAATGIKRVFVYPGGTIAPLINSFLNLGIPIEVFKHEQGAVYAALAEARLTGKTQVAMVTSGPGVTNAITPLADAYYDSTPLMLITGQIGTSDLCSGRKVRQRGFQEVPTLALTSEISKASRCPLNGVEALNAVQELFTIAGSARPGPVVLDFPMDVQRSASPDPFLMTQSPSLPTQSVSLSCCKEIADALVQARRTVILLGHGALQSAAFETYIELANRSDALVVSSLLGLGSFPTVHPRFLGYIGHTGHEIANKAVHQADILLAIGSRLDVRQTGTVTESFVPNGKIAWINNDFTEINHPRVITHWNLVADAGECSREILKLMTTAAVADKIWQKSCKDERAADKEDPIRDTSLLSPKEVLKKIGKLMLGSKGVVTTGVGSHQHWAARHLSFAPGEWQLLTSAGHGAMGYDLPTAIGAAITRPGERVLCVVGDGSLLMNIQELASVAERKLPIKILVLNNSRLGIVSQFQKITWGTDPTTGDFPSPDFAAIARGFGINGAQVANRTELENALNYFWGEEGPALLNVIIDPHADIVPMLLGGQTMDKMWQGY